MFSSKIVNSDPFFEMPTSSQLLYFHLGMNADDEGFVYPKSIMRMAGSNEDDLKILVAKKFLLPFESGVIVLKHWNVNNTIRSDRKLKTTHEVERKTLHIDDGGVYRVIDNLDAALRSPKEVINQLNNKSTSEVPNGKRGEQLIEEMREIARGKRVS